MTGTHTTESNPFDPSWPFTPDETVQLNAWLEERQLELHIGRAPEVSFVGFYRAGKRVAGSACTPGAEAEIVKRYMRQGLH